jgi:hypothetical protein
MRPWRDNSHRIVHADLLQDHPGGLLVETVYGRSDDDLWVSTARRSGLNLG